MKFNSLQTLLSVVGVILVLTAASCGNKKGTTTQIPDNDITSVTFRTDSISWADSVEVGRNSAICKITVNYPDDGGKALVDSLRTWIAGQLSASNFVLSNPNTPYLPNEDMLSNGKTMIAEIGRRVLNNTVPDLQQLDSLKSSRVIRYEYYWNIAPVYQNSKAITYSNSTYCYLGGAHGGASYTQQVFRMTDGQQFGWSNMFIPDSVPTLKQLVKESLRTNFFKATTETAFKEALLVNPDTLPLPKAQPYFTADGVAFSYGQYEIAPYASGMPSCTIPYSKVRSLMTPEAAILISE